MLVSDDVQADNLATHKNLYSGAVATTQINKIDFLIL